MDTGRKRKLIAGAVVLAALAGGGGAIAATKLGGPGADSKAIIDDAAGRLGVSPAALSDALKKAMEGRVDAAVQAGTLTKEQGDALKKQIEAQDYPALGFGVRAFGHERLPGFGFFGAGLGAVTDYLKITEAQLRTELSSGKTLAEVAKAHGKTAEGLVSALTDAAKKQIEAAVTGGKLTRAQADSLESQLQQRFTDLVNGQGFRGALPRGGPFFGHPGGAFGLHRMGAGRGRAA
jgi:hypothetical protein